MPHTLIAPDEARALYDERDPVHDFDHVLRVLRLAQRIAAAEGADSAIVETAMLLHDIHRSRESGADGTPTDDDAEHMDDHALLAAAAARDILAGRGAAPAFIEAVAHAIAAHRFRNAIEPATLEAQVVFDADKLDAIGAIGVARAYAYGAAHGQKLWGPVPAGYAGAGPDHTAHHEFVYKLAHIKDRLYTPTGRALAAQRHAFMTRFFAQLAAEVAGDA